MTKLDDFLVAAAEDCINAGVPPIRDEDLRDHSTFIDPPEPEAEASSFSGVQLGHDIRAVQLRAENFSPAMVEKAGRLYHLGYRAHGDQSFEIPSESGDAWHTVRVWGSLTWLATCTCPARTSRWNRAGACAHRALGGYLRAQITGLAIPRWPALELESWTRPNDLEV